MDREWLTDGSYDPYSYVTNDFYQEYQGKQPLAEFFPPQAQQYSMQQHRPPSQPADLEYTSVVPRGENPREIRNKAEKQRRDKLKESISELASIVPPVVAANKKIDKTGVLRLTAHYLRAYQYVFGDTIGRVCQEFTPASMRLLLSLLRGFLITTTYKGLIVVVSQNIQDYLGHAELDLLGQNIINYIHPEDRQKMKENLMPDTQLLGPNGELLVPDEPLGEKKIAAALAGEKRRFLVRFKKHTQRSEPVSYVPCYVEGTLRKSDRACRVTTRCRQVVRRARARADNPCSSGNDVVFIGMVRPATETFMSEKHLEAFRMEYRTRHSVDGEIMECDQRISLVAGYMTHEVNGVNAMNFIHQDDVRWVIFTLREMYDQQRIVGESCYRLMTKSGQFIYLRTRGILDVNESSRAVRSFVCTNTVVDEKEGKRLIEMMKQRCMNVINHHKSPPREVEELKKVEEIIPEREHTEDQTLPVQDLEKVILHLVANLPSPKPSSQAGDSRSNSPERNESPSLPLAIIPPQREKILSAIEKIYSVIELADKREQSEMRKSSRLNPRAPAASPPKSPKHNCIMEQNRRGITRRRQLEEVAVPSLNAEPQDQPAFYAGNNQINFDDSLNSRKRSQITDDVHMIKRKNSGVPTQQEPAHAAMPPALIPQIPEEVILFDYPLPDFDFGIGDDEAYIDLDSIQLDADLPWRQQPGAQ